MADGELPAGFVRVTAGRCVAIVLAAHADDAKSMLAEGSLYEAAARDLAARPLQGRGVAYAIANKAMFVKSFGSGVPMMLRGSPFPDGFNAIPMPREKPQSSQRWNQGKDQRPEKGWLTDPDDPRIGKVVQGWKPPKMVHVRGGE